MVTKSVIILAPHPDDEVIGCWSLLQARQVKDVYYFFDCTDARKSEAQQVADTFGFTPHFEEEVPTNVDGTLVMPSIHDSHPDHKAVNRKYRGRTLNRLFYSVDLNEGAKVAVEDSRLKRHCLDNLYASQKALWATDASYYLFERLRLHDYEASYKHTAFLCGTQLTVLTDLAYLEAQSPAVLSPDALMDALISAGASRVRFEFDYKEYSYGT